MKKRKGTNNTMVDQILHRKLRMEQYQHNSGTSEGLAVPAPLVLLLLKYGDTP
jgi:hypothetical protein